MRFGFYQRFSLNLVSTLVSHLAKFRATYQLDFLHLVGGWLDPSQRERKKKGIFKKITQQNQ